MDTSDPAINARAVDLMCVAGSHPQGWEYGVQRGLITEEDRLFLMERRAALAAERAARTAPAMAPASSPVTSPAIPGTRGAVDLQQVSQGLSGDKWGEVPWGDLLNTEFTPNPPFQGGLLAPGELGFLAGPGKVGKSLIALDFAYRVAQGEAWLGDAAQPPRRVLYLDMENTKPQFIGRMRSLGFKPCANLIYLSFPVLGFLDSAEGGATFAEALERYEPELVIVDTLARFIQGEENSRATFNDAYNYSWLRAKARGVAVLRLDHTGKENEDKDPPKSPIGSAGKTHDVDQGWMISELGNKLMLQRTWTRTGEGRDYMEIERQGLKDDVTDRWVDTRHAIVPQGTLVAPGQYKMSRAEAAAVKKAEKQAEKQAEAEARRLKAASEAWERTQVVIEWIRDKYPQIVTDPNSVGIGRVGKDTQQIIAITGQPVAAANIRRAVETVKARLQDKEDPWTGKPLGE